MADFRTSYWDDAYWEAADVGSSREIWSYLDSLSLQIYQHYGESIINAYTASYIESTLYDEFGRAIGYEKVWGGDFTNPYATSYRVTKYDYAINGVAVVLSGEMTLAEEWGYDAYGYWDIDARLSGAGVKASINDGGVSHSVSGDFSIGLLWGGYTLANASVVTQTSSGSTITQRINADENLYQFILDQEGNRLTVDGYWPNQSFSSFYELARYDDRFYGTSNGDFFTSNAGNDSYYGEAGIDVVKYSGSSSGYRINREDESSIIVTNLSGSEGTDSLRDVERLVFADQAIAMDIDGSNSAGGIYRTYQAAFNRDPDVAGFGYWIDRADNGASAVQMAEEFVWSVEFQERYGVKTPYLDNYLTGYDIETLVDGFYHNILGRAPDLEGLDFYTGVIVGHERTVGRVLAEIADSPENRDNLLPIIQGGMEYELWLG